MAALILDFWKFVIVFISNFGVINKNGTANIIQKEDEKKNLHIILITGKFQEAEKDDFGRCRSATWHTHKLYIKHAYTHT